MKFAVLEDLFSGYTVVHNLDTSLTSVWCERCDEWVYEYADTQSMDELELYESVIDSHTEKLK